MMLFWQVTLVFNRRLKDHSDKFPNTRKTSVTTRVHIDSGEIGKPNPDCNAGNAVKIVMEENNILMADLIAINTEPCGSPTL